MAQVCSNFGSRTFAGLLLTIANAGANIKITGDQSMPLMTTPKRDREI